MDDHSTNHWSEGLSSVIFAINTRMSHITKKTPYQLVFGQEPRANIHHWKSLHDTAVINDVEMDDLLIDKIGTVNNEIVMKESAIASDSNQLHNESGLKVDSNHCVSFSFFSNTASFNTLPNATLQGKQNVEKSPFVLTSTKTIANGERFLLL